jgi:hypothetical protein
MSSSDEERKKRSDSESEEESEEVESEEESEEETSEEETSEEESTESTSEKTSSASTSAKATPRSATTTPRGGEKKEEAAPPKTKAKEDNGDGKKADKKSDKKKKKGKKTKKNDEQSVVVIDGRTVLKKTFELTKDKLVEFTVSVENRPYKPEEKVEIKFEIKNQTSKTMKSIKCVLETKGAKPEGNGKDKKKAKKPKKGEAERGLPSGTEDEFFCGARFPLDKYTDFKGTDSYRLPKKVEKTSGQVKHELHLAFPIRSRPINSWKNIDAWLPIEIGN